MSLETVMWMVTGAQLAMGVLIILLRTLFSHRDHAHRTKALVATERALWS